MDKEVNIMKAAEKLLYASCLHMQRIIIIQYDGIDSINHISNTLEIQRGIYYDSDDLD